MHSDDENGKVLSDLPIEKDKSTVSSANSQNDNIIAFDHLQAEVDRTFTQKKLDSLVISDAYQKLSKNNTFSHFAKKSQRVSECGTFLEWAIRGSDHKLINANFCKDRLCPMCNWRRSLKIYGQTSAIMDVLQGMGFDYLFLTLTVKSCLAEDLSATIDELFKGWRYLYNKNKRFREICEGCFRSLEITRNKQTGLYHPHLHSIIAVKKDYWSNHYIKASEWSALWKKACKLEYDPVIYVEKVKPRYGDLDTGIKHAVLEVSKYAVKSSDIITRASPEQIEIVRDFSVALSNRRLCEYYGIFRKVKQDLHLDDPEDGNLVNTDNIQLRPDLADLIIRCHWKNGLYVYE